MTVWCIPACLETALSRLIHMKKSCGSHFKGTNWHNLGFLKKVFCRSKEGKKSCYILVYASKTVLFDTISLREKEVLECSKGFFCFFLVMGCGFSRLVLFTMVCCCFFSFTLIVTIWQSDHMFTSSLSLLRSYILRLCYKNPFTVNDTVKMTNNLPHGTPAIQLLSKHIGSILSSAKMHCGRRSNTFMYFLF